MCNLEDSWRAEEETLGKLLSSCNQITGRRDWNRKVSGQPLKSGAFSAALAWIGGLTRR
jgi:hypothetical protein